MKKVILIGIVAISMLAAADTTDARKILEQYRKEALQRQLSKFGGKIDKKTEDLLFITDIITDDEDLSEYVNGTSGTEVTPDIIEKVNSYLKYNPEKNQKLKKHYIDVVGQE